MMHSMAAPADLDAACAQLSADLLLPLVRQREAQLRAFGAAFGGDTATIAAFAAAWRLCYQAVLVIDHIQDGDPLEVAWLAALPTPLQYHVGWSLLNRAEQHLLRLSEQLVPAAGRDVRQMWCDTSNLLAQGQYRDLRCLHGLDAEPEQPLAQYEQIALAKTGSLFAFGLGGMTRVVSDNPQWIRAATHLGTLIGMLVQYADDLRDPASSPVNLGHLVRTHAAAITDETARNAHLWHALQAAYQPSIAQWCAHLPPAVHVVVSELGSYRLPVVANEETPWPDDAGFNQPQPFQP